MSSIIDQLEALNGSNAAAHSAIDEQLDEFELAMKNQLKKLNEIKVDRIKARVEAEKANQEVSTSLKNTCETRVNSLAELKSKFEAFVIEMSCEEKACLKLIESTDQLNTETSQQLMNSLNNLNSENTLLPNDMKAIIDDHKQRIAQQFTEANNLIDDSIKNCDKQLSTKQTTLKSMDNTLVVKIEEQKAVMNDIISNMKEISDCVSDKTSEMVRLGETMEKSQEREIQNRYKSFERFVKNDLMRDLPTGSTPQKTTYDYPKKLVITSPHDRILERFRLTRAAETPLPEECESEILSDSSSSLKSLESIQSNDENTKPLTDTQKRKKVGLRSKLRPKQVSPKDLSLLAQSDKRSVTPKPLATNLNN